MTILKILQYPDPRLGRIATKVDNVNEPHIQQAIEDMFETHYATQNCAALAATQLDMDPAWRITVIDFSSEKNQPLCLVNPEIISQEGEHIEAEGCMSVYPNLIQEKVKRAEKIIVRAQDKKGHFFELAAEGFLAKCIQHEIDHLEGKIFLKHLPQFKVEKINRKIKKYLRVYKDKLNG